MKPGGDRDSVLARYLDGPTRLERRLEGLENEDLDAIPRQGGWSIRQIVHHIVDGDDLWKIGIKAALGNSQGEFTLEWYWTIPQEVWADRWAYARRPLEVSLALFRASRSHVLELLEHVPDGWNRTIQLRRPNGTKEGLSVGAVVEMQTDHLEHHVKRIDAIRRERDEA